MGSVPGSSLTAASAVANMIGGVFSGFAEQGTDFARAQTKLQELKLIGTWEGFVWPVL